LHTLAKHRRFAGALTKCDGFFGLLIVVTDRQEPCLQEADRTQGFSGIRRQEPAA
jgi:hypothetical protein